VSLNRILDAIPHRPPFLWIDEVLEEDATSIRALKRIDPQEPALRGHYPRFPIVPGVLVLEAIFQAGSVLLANQTQTALAQGWIPVLARAREAKFKRMVRPGDRLELSVRLLDSLGKAYKLAGEARVDGQLAASVEYMVALVPPAPPEEKEPAEASGTGTGQPSGAGTSAEAPSASAGGQESAHAG
jgi:3-hydroxyacyl-[acyl-carrier-protein] dehydratase